MQQGGRKRGNGFMVLKGGREGGYFWTREVIAPTVQLWSHLGTNSSAQLLILFRLSLVYLDVLLLSPSGRIISFF